jgi:hypothetical protein
MKTNEQSENHEDIEDDRGLKTDYLKERRKRRELHQ